MSFGSVFHSVGAVYKNEHSLYNLVLTDGMHSMSAEDQFPRGCVNLE